MSSRFCFPFMLFCYVMRSLVTLGLSSKEMNMIEMMSHGLREPPVRLVAIYFNLGNKDNMN